ncbi:MAG TPA: hypothetical protein IAA41_03755 [Candidatus Eubacterium faecavium]|nr:hypothetical protein [Candidatus Eubacterium faecavium]
MSNSVKKLKDAIHNTMPLSDIINAFEKWCLPLNEEDMILFETGTYRFTGEPQFYFSLVKQFPNELDDEYYQIHIDVLYDPTDKTDGLNTTVWNEEIEENIFEFIRRSADFNCVKNEKYKSIEIYKDET